MHSDQFLMRTDINRFLWRMNSGLLALFSGQNRLRLRKLSLNVKKAQAFCCCLFNSYSWQPTMRIYWAINNSLSTTTKMRSWSNLCIHGKFNNYSMLFSCPFGPIWTKTEIMRFFKFKFVKKLISSYAEWRDQFFSLQECGWGMCAPCGHQ